MLQLPRFNQFGGIDAETSAVRHALAYQGFTLPQTGEAPSEALLFGISGGLVAGYFTAEYAGHPPHMHFLTRNTFEPFTRLLQNLGIKPKRLLATTPEKGYTQLTDTLAAGEVPLVWADLFSLPYSTNPPMEGFWHVIPVIVWAIDEASGVAHLSDRARVDLVVPLADLAQARGRIAKEKHRILTLSLPDPERLPKAVEAGIAQTIISFEGPPPVKPMQGRWGFDAFTRWAELLTSKKGWQKEYSPGRRLWSMLTSAFRSTQVGESGAAGGRALFAQFLREGALILERPGLAEVAAQYDRLADAWTLLGELLLPDGPMAEARQLMQRESQLFREAGAASLAERQAIGARLKELSVQADREFPLTEAGVIALRQRVADHLITLRDQEAAAIRALSDA